MLKDDRDALIEARDEFVRQEREKYLTTLRKPLRFSYDYKREFVDTILPHSVIVDSFTPHVAPVAFWLGNLLGARGGYVSNGGILASNYESFIYRRFNCLYLNISPEDSMSARIPDYHSIVIGQNDDNLEIALKNHLAEYNEPFNIFDGIQRVINFMTIKYAMGHCTSHYHDARYDFDHVDNYKGVAVCETCKEKHEDEQKRRIESSKKPKRETPEKPHRKREREKMNNKLRTLIFKRDGLFCKKCEAVDNLQIDHIIPISRGGYTTEDNLQVLCRSCNLSKGFKTMPEWLKYLESHALPPNRQ